MIKTALYGSVALAALGGLVFGRDAVSYLKTSVSSVRKSIKAEVPLEFEIQRARKLVDQLGPDIRQCMHVIAEEEVNIEELKTDIARRETRLGQQKEQILTLRNDIGGGKDKFKFAGRIYTSDEIRRDLSQRFERFKVAEETVASKRQIMNAREKSLHAAREKLDGMLTAKQDLEIQVENLDARLKTLQAAETDSQVSIDDSQLSRVKKLIRELNKQLDVKERILDSMGHLSDLIPVEIKSDVPEDLSVQIDDYFGKTSPVPALAESADKSL